jgi:hypothetical protein
VGSVTIIFNVPVILGRLPPPFLPFSDKFGIVEDKGALRNVCSVIDDGDTQFAHAATPIKS